MSSYRRVTRSQASGSRAAVSTPRSSKNVFRNDVDDVHSTDADRNQRDPSSKDSVKAQEDKRKSVAVSRLFKYDDLTEKQLVRDEESRDGKISPNIDNVFDKMSKDESYISKDAVSEIGDIIQHEVRSAMKPIVQRLERKIKIDQVDEVDFEENFSDSENDVFENKVERYIEIKVTEAIKPLQEQLNQISTLLLQMRTSSESSDIGQNINGKNMEVNSNLDVNAKNINSTRKVKIAEEETMVHDYDLNGGLKAKQGKSKSVIKNSKNRSVKSKGKSRKSLLAENVALGMNPDSDYDSSGSSSNSNSSDSDSGSDTRMKIYKKQNNVLHTLSQDAPKCPILKKLDDAGFVQLWEDYKNYVTDCARLGIKGKSIDHCIVNTSVSSLRDEFKYGFLDMLPTDTEDFGPESVMKYIKLAKSNMYVGKKDVCVNLLKKNIEGTYNMELDSVKARVNSLKSAAVKYLNEGGCLDYWIIDKDNKNKYKQQRKLIVDALLNAIKPMELQKALKMQVINSDLKYDHVQVLKIIEKEGSIWDEIDKKKSAVEKVEMNLDHAKNDNVYDKWNKQIHKQSINTGSADPGNNKAQIEANHAGGSTTEVWYCEHAV